MKGEAMESRPRVLVVEDIDSARESFVANLRFTGDYRVEGAGDLDGAIAAMDRLTFHVAAVDIMLAGERDVANRDGVAVARRFQRLAEGTKVVILSAQEETQLVRDLIRDYGAYDYLDKGRVQSEGIELLLATVAKAAAVSGVGSTSWEVLAQRLSPRMSEHQLVAELMQRLNFKGGFENLHRALAHNCRHLVPLLHSMGDNDGLAYNEERSRFEGIYWAKGQGLAVEIVVADAQSLVPEVNEAPASVLVDKEKGGLRIVAVERPALDREGFEAQLLDVDGGSPMPES
jgi:DNA-binding NarL/FixJ family response regulator